MGINGLTGIESVQSVHRSLSGCHGLKIVFMDKLNRAVGQDLFPDSPLGRVLSSLSASSLAEVTWIEPFCNPPMGTNILLLKSKPAVPVGQL